MPGDAWQFLGDNKPVVGFVAALFTIIQPLMLYAKCKMQIKRSENINAALHYILSEDGICVSQDGQEVQVKWYDIRKAVYAKKGVYLYMSPVRAFIFPEGQCGNIMKFARLLGGRWKSTKIMFQRKRK